jgi:transposase
VLAAAGADLHLAHPLGVKGFAYRRVKNDERDAADLADLLRMGRLPEAWVAPPAVRELRELVRHRHKLRQTASGFKAQAHAVLAKNGIIIAGSDMFGPTGRARLERAELPAVFRARLNSQLRVLEALEFEITLIEKLINARLAGNAAFRALLQLDGIGPALGPVFYAEIGDVHRFPSPAHLCSWAGLTPRHRESDTHIHRGRITKQGSKLVRWAAVEAVQHTPAGSPMRAVYDRIVTRRGAGAKHIARVAAARVLLTCVYYALRDGHVRRLHPTAP